MLFLSFGEHDDDAKGKKKGKRGGGDDDDKGLRSGAEEPKIELGMGVLFGATEATPDVTFEWDLEVSF